MVCVVMWWCSFFQISLKYLLHHCHWWWWHWRHWLRDTLTGVFIHKNCQEDEWYNYFCFIEYRNFHWIASWWWHTSTAYSHNWRPYWTQWDNDSVSQTGWNSYCTIPRSNISDTRCILTLTLTLMLNVSLRITIAGTLAKFLSWQLGKFFWRLLNLKLPIYI